MAARSNEGKSTCQLSGGGAGPVWSPFIILPLEWADPVTDPSNVPRPTAPSNNLPAPAADTLTIFSASVSSRKTQKKNTSRSRARLFSFSFFHFCAPLTKKKKKINGGARVSEKHVSQPIGWGGAARRQSSSSRF